MDVGLTPEQVKNIYYRLFNKNIDVYVYDDIIRCRDLEQLFKRNNYFILYYPFNECLGHYCCLVKNNNTIFFMIH